MDFINVHKFHALFLITFELLMKIAYHSSYSHPLPQNHRFPMEKYQRLQDNILNDFELLDLVFFEPEPMPWKWIEVVHDSAYTNKLQNGIISDSDIRALGFPFSESLVMRERRIVQGTWDLVKYAVEEGKFGFNIAGGTHHAFSDKPAGYCLLNDFAIAGKLALFAGLERVLIVDLDVHQGNGTASILKNEPNIFTFSMHGDKTYPLIKEESDLDISLPPGTDDEEYLDVLHLHLDMLFSEIQPDLVLYNAGADVLNSDEVGTLGLSLAGCAARDEMVFRYCSEMKIPAVVAMGGGYSKNIDEVLNVHLQTFKTARFWEQKMQ